MTLECGALQGHVICCILLRRDTLTFCLFFKLLLILPALLFVIILCFFTPRILCSLCCSLPETRPFFLPLRALDSFISSIFHHLQCSNSYWLQMSPYLPLKMANFALFLIHVHPLSFSAFSCNLPVTYSLIHILSCCNKSSACLDHCEKPFSMTLSLSCSCPLSYLSLLVDTVTEFNCQAALITAELSFFLSAHFMNDWAVLHKSPSEIHLRWFPPNPVISSLCSASLSCYPIIPGINGHPFSSTPRDGPSN